MMDHATQLQSTAEQALAAMRAAGFEQAQVTASRKSLDELSAVDNEPALLRSTESRKLALLGLVDGRMASTEVSDLRPDAVRDAIAGLFNDASSAPRDEANAVSGGERARIVQGPQEGDRAQITAAMRGLLAFRRTEAPRMVISEAECSHHLREWHTLTSGGSDLAGRVGWYSLSGFGTAREGSQSSSFNAAGGFTHQLDTANPAGMFGIADMMKDTQRQVRTQPVGGKFVGDVVLMPNAVAALLGWFLGQLSDLQLISGSSLYKERVGERIAADAVTLRGRFDMPGVAAVSSDAFATPDVTLLEQGVLRTLTPTLYGSRKTGLPHRPVAGGGWEILPGDTPLPQMVGSVRRGAIVGRLSMGNPAANGNFSGVIKNSFLIDGGEVGPALSETMVSGNMAQMLMDVVAVSREALDGDGWRLPWVRIANLHFS
jgi:PmbA protein